MNCVVFQSLACCFTALLLLALPRTVEAQDAELTNVLSAIKAQQVQLEAQQSRIEELERALGEAVGLGPQGVSQDSVGDLERVQEPCCEDPSESAGWLVEVRPKDGVGTPVGQERALEGRGEDRGIPVGSSRPSSASASLPAGSAMFSSYGVINAFVYDWESDPDRRNSIDVTRVTFEGEYKLTADLKLEAELEIEHLGTGASIEFDRFEEFGEFEQEISRGGEVELEELYLEWQPHQAFELKAGHFPIPIGSLGRRHRPRHHFTVHRHEGEIALLPSVWSETGLEIGGKLPELIGGQGLRYALGVVSGLDSTGFSSANWIRRGYQTRFEASTLEDLAGYFRLDWLAPLEGVGLGASLYHGDTADNRPKPDLDEDAYVTIWSVDGYWERGPLTLRAALIDGHLQNAAAVTAANKRLSNNLNVKRTPVASDAFARWIEIGFDPSSIATRWPTGLVPYLRYDRYDSMASVEAPVADNPRWDRTTWTAGFEYRFHPNLQLKLQYSTRRLGVDEENRENTWALGMAYDIALAPIHIGLAGRGR